MMLISISMPAQSTRGAYSNTRGNNSQISRFVNSGRSTSNQSTTQKRQEPSSIIKKDLQNDESDISTAVGRMPEDRLTNNNNSQQTVKLEKDDVTLVVNGSGKDKTEATKAALRSAIEQAYGVFVSANTDILNDEMVKDEVATIASGNIKSYKELSSTNLPDGTVSVSLSAVVSTGKLVSYVQAHGGSAEFAGQTFLMEMRMRELNADNEAAAMRNLYNELKALLPVLYDCNIFVGTPQVAQFHKYSGRNYLGPIDTKAYRLPLGVIIRPTDNYVNWMNKFAATLSSLALAETDINEYINNGMDIYCFVFSENRYILRQSYDNIDFAKLLNEWKNHWQIVLSNGSIIYPKQFDKLVKYNDIEYCRTSYDGYVAEGDCVLYMSSENGENIGLPYMPDAFKDNLYYGVEPLLWQYIVSERSIVYGKVFGYSGNFNRTMKTIVLENRFRSRNPFDKNWTAKLSFDYAFSEEIIGALQNIEIRWNY